MARPYSQKFLMELNAAESPSLGILLAKVCIDANLSTTHVAKAFDVSRITVHSWFRGAKIHARRHQAIDAFIRLVNMDMANKSDAEYAVNLPAANIHISKHYIETMLGRAI